MKTIEAGFELYNWQCERIEERNAVRSVFNGRSTSYQVFVMRMLGEGLYRFVILSPLQVEPAQMGAMSEFLHRLNGNLPLGAFELDFNNRGLRWTSSVETNGDTMPPHWIGNSMQRGLTSFETVWPELLAVAEGRIAAQTAELRSQVAMELPALNTRFESSGLQLKLAPIDDEAELLVISSGDNPAPAKKSLEEIFGHPLPFGFRQS
jgi:hypothetical protein